MLSFENPYEVVMHFMRYQEFYEGADEDLEERILKS